MVGELQPKFWLKVLHLLDNPPWAAGRRLGGIVLTKSNQISVLLFKIRIFFYPLSQKSQIFASSPCAQGEPWALPRQKVFRQSVRTPNYEVSLVSFCYILLLAYPAERISLTYPGSGQTAGRSGPGGRWLPGCQRCRPYRSSGRKPAGPLLVSAYRSLN